LFGLEFLGFSPKAVGGLGLWMWRKTDPSATLGMTTDLNRLSYQSCFPKRFDISMGTPEKSLFSRLLARFLM
jgi:hypothetical protein